MQPPMDLYSTHLPILTAAVLNSDGPVIEVGCGCYSTPILSAICTSMGRQLLTLENDAGWLSWFVSLASPTHRLLHVPEWATCEEIDREYGLAFVDHGPAGRRSVDIHRMKDKVDLIVVHDTESNEYDYESVFPLFKWSYTFKRLRPTTSVLSMKDQSEWLAKLPLAREYLGL